MIPDQKPNLPPHPQLKFHRKDVVLQQLATQIRVIVSRQ